MKPNSYLVNTSRRELVSEDALLKALKSGHIKAAALDIQDDPERGMPLKPSEFWCLWYTDKPDKKD